MTNGITNIVLKMQDAGFTREQVDVITEYIDTGAATKDELKADIKRFGCELRLVHWTVGLSIAIGLANLYLILRLA